MEQRTQTLKSFSVSDLHFVALIGYTAYFPCTLFIIIFTIPHLGIFLRIENHSMFLPLRIRQVDGFVDSWRFLPPNTAISFYWEDLGRQRLLEVLVDGSDPSNSQKINIDKVIDHQLLQISSGDIRPLSLSILKEGKIFSCKISDWMPDDDEAIVPYGTSPMTSSHSSPHSDYRYESSPAEIELHIILELSDFGLSIFDHTPEEILYLSIQYLLISYSTGLGSGLSR